jgi:hypothetical protein
MLCGEAEANRFCRLWPYLYEVRATGRATTADSEWWTNAVNYLLGRKIEGIEGWARPYWSGEFTEHEGQFGGPEPEVLLDGEARIVRLLRAPK